MSDSDFDLDKSHWFNVNGIDMASRWMRGNIEKMQRHARALAEHHHSPEVEMALSDAETALSDCLLAIKIEKEKYARKHLSMAAE